MRWRCIRISWKAAPASCWNSPPILNNSRNNLTTRIVKQLGHVHEIESRSGGWKENCQWLCWPRFRCRRSLCEAWFQGCDSKTQEMLDYWFEAIACRKCGVSHLEYICWAIAGSRAFREGMTFRTQLVLEWPGLRAGPQEWTSLTSPWTKKETLISMSQLPSNKIGHLFWRGTSTFQNFEDIWMDLYCQK